MQQISEQVRQRASVTIIDLMDGGGTFPIQTYDFLAEDSPDVLVGLSRQELIDLCNEIQRSELPEASRQFQDLFREFNHRYFAGSLPEYQVRVVYDIGYWAGPPFHEGAMGIHQPELRRILIRIAHDHSVMVSILLYEMARAAAAGEHDRLLHEMRRLRNIGAPVENIDCYEEPRPSMNT
jgi:hypothetical protein